MKQKKKAESLEKKGRKRQKNQQQTTLYQRLRLNRDTL